MKPSALQKLLTTIIVIALLASGAGFYYVQSSLSETATQVGKSISESESSGVLNNESLKAQVAEASDASKKALALKIESDDYQNQITSDVKAYAASNNITISNYSFAANSTGAESSETKTPTQNNSSSNASAMTMTLSNPVNFNDLMKFLKSLETNIPKIQITNLKITHDKNYKNSVSVDPIIVQGYIGG